MSAKKIVSILVFYQCLVDDSNLSKPIILNYLNTNSKITTNTSDIILPFTPNKNHIGNKWFIPYSVLLLRMIIGNFVECNLL